MEQLANGFSLEIPRGLFPLSTDSMALADFAKIKRDDRVLDLGSGCGTLGILLCASNPGCHVTGIELDGAAHAAAVENIRRNGLEDRMESIHADLRQLPAELIPGSYQICISNPPYFSGGPNSALGSARREDQCTAAELFRTAARMLKYGGDFYLVHRPERLAELCAKGAAENLEAKELLLLRHRSDGPISLILLRLRKGGKPGLTLTEESLHDAAGEPTAYYRSVYHIL